MRAVLPAAQAQREQRAGDPRGKRCSGSRRATATPATCTASAFGAARTSRTSGSSICSPAHRSRGPSTIRACFEIGAVRHEVGLRHQAGVGFALIHQPRGVRCLPGIRSARRKVQIWNRCYDPGTRTPLGVEPFFKGYVNDAPIERPVPGGVAVIEVGDRVDGADADDHLGVEEVHAAQQRRIGDIFRKYKTTAGRWDVPWEVRDVASRVDRAPARLAPAAGGLSRAPRRPSDSVMARRTVRPSPPERWRR